jgi:hypothetical protein
MKLLRESRLLAFFLTIVGRQDSPGAANGSHWDPNDAIAGEKLRLHVDPAQGLGGRDDGDVLEAFEAQ